jgi:hypothetical protein
MIFYFIFNKKEFWSVLIPYKFDVLFLKMITISIITKIWFF